MPGNFYTTQNYKNIPKETIHDPHFLEMVILAGGVANGLFRVVWGTMLR